VIDLSGMRALDIDADAKTAWAETGITAGEYTSAVGERGRATGLATPARSGSAESLSGWNRLPGPEVRADDRRPASGRGGHRRW
jgi:hypothetical protein